MGIDIVKYNAPAEVHRVLLDVELTTPTQLVVRAGDIKISKVAYTLVEDEEWDLPVIPEGGMEVVGNLVLNPVNGEMHVLVDELSSGVVGYGFGVGVDESFQLLHPLFRFRLGAGTVTLSGVDIEVVHFTVVPREEP